MKIALLSGSPEAKTDVNTKLIHRFMKQFPEDAFDVLYLAKSMSPYETARRINSCDGAVLFVPTAGSLSYCVSKFLNECEFMIRRDMPFVLIAHTPLTDAKKTETVMDILDVWSEKAKISLRLSLGVGCSFYCLYGRRLSHYTDDLFLKTREALDTEGRKREFAVLGNNKGLYRWCVTHWFMRRAENSHIDRQAFYGEAAYLHYL